MARSSLNRSLILRQVFVNDISPSTTEADIRQLFSDVGTVEHVEVDTNDLNRRFAFITFSTAEECEQIITRFNSVELRGSRLVLRRRSDLDAMRESRLRQSRCKLFVGNIPNDVSKDTLRSELEHLAEHRIIDFRHKKGYCFLGFATPKDAENARHALKNVVCHGKPLNVEVKKEENIRNDDKFISVLEQAERTLYIRDIPKQTNIDTFKTRFEKHGKIRKFTLPVDKVDGSLIGYSFVEYFTKEECDTALQKCKNMIVDNIAVEVRISDPPKENRSKQDNNDSHRRSDNKEKDRNKNNNCSQRQHNGSGRDNRNSGAASTKQRNDAEWNHSSVAPYRRGREIAANNGYYAYGGDIYHNTRHPAYSIPVSAAPTPPNYSTHTRMLSQAGSPRYGYCTPTTATRNEGGDIRSYVSCSTDSYTYPNNYTGEFASKPLSSNSSTTAKHNNYQSAYYQNNYITPQSTTVTTSEEISPSNEENDSSLLNCFRNIQINPIPQTQSPYQPNNAMLSPYRNPSYQDAGNTMLPPNYVRSHHDHLKY